MRGLLAEPARQPKLGLYGSHACAAKTHYHWPVKLIISARKDVAANKLIAFDQSTTNTGWAVLEQETGALIDFGALHPQGETNARIRRTVKQCIALCTKYRPTFVFIEGIQIQRNPKVYEILAKLQGTVEICLEEQGYIVNVVRANEWRQRIGIKGRRRKEFKAAAMALVDDLYGDEAEGATEDTCEAICFGRAFCDGDE